MPETRSSPPDDPAIARRAPLEVVTRAIDAYERRELQPDLIAPGFRFAGTKPHGSPFEWRTTPAEHVADAAAMDGFTSHTRRLVEGTDGRVMIEMSWSLDGEAGGFAGLFWMVASVVRGLIEELRFFDGERAARRFAGIAPGVA